MALATFIKWKVKVPGVSVELISSDENQFTDKLEAPNAKLIGQYLMNIFEMKNYSGAYTARERGMFGIHFSNSTSGAIDETWITADYTAVESAVQSFWSTQAASLPSYARLVEQRWYPFGPGFVGTKSSPIPPSRVTFIGSPVAGTQAEPNIRQVGGTITLRTTLRRHWGRFYVPWANNSFSTNGQASSATVDAWVAAARTMLLAAETSQGVVPVVYDKVRKQAYGVTSIESDSVPDIQRRRRPRDPGYKKVVSV